MNKRHYKVYGIVNGTEYLLGTIESLGNANIFAEAMMKSYAKVRVE